MALEFELINILDNTNEENQDNIKPLQIGMMDYDT